MMGLDWTQDKPFNLTVIIISPISAIYLEYFSKINFEKLDENYLKMRRS
jgi:hypothetical protein